MNQKSGPARVVLFTVIGVNVEAFRVALKQRGDRLVGVVTAPGPRNRRSDDYRDVVALARPGLDVVVSNYPNRWAGMIRPLMPDIVVCSGFNWKIPQDVLEVPRLGAFNVHDSVLPSLRGRNATGWALRTGESGLGHTCHRLGDDFDTGPILSQRAVEIADDEDFDDIRDRWWQAAVETVVEGFDRMLEGYPGIPQDESAATWAGGAFEPEWREIDWNKPVRDVFFQIRSWCGFREVPLGAYGEIDGQRMLITKANPLKDPVTSNGVPPGTVLSRNDGEILIKCADGPLRILKWEEATIE